MTKNERIAALEKQVADLTERINTQDLVIAAMRGPDPWLQRPSQWPSGPYIPYSTCVSSGPENPEVFAIKMARAS